MFEWWNVEFNTQKQIEAEKGKTKMEKHSQYQNNKS